MDLEQWQRDGRTVTIVMDEPGVVRVSIDAFRLMLAEAGFERIEG